MSTYLVSIPASILRCLSTPLLSRVMRQAFGSLLYTLIDKRMDATWRLLFIKYAHQALKWEPRIRVVRLVPISADDDGRVSVRIEYEELETKQIKEEQMYVAIAA